MWLQHTRRSHVAAAAVAVAVKFTPYAARDKQLSAHFHALVNRNKRSVPAKKPGERQGGRNTQPTFYTRSDARTAGAGWCWSLLPGRIINYQFYRQPLWVGGQGKKLSLAFGQRSLPQAVASFCEGRCHVVWAQRLYGSISML